MATSRIKTSSVLQGFPKSRSLLAGNAAYIPPGNYDSLSTVIVGSGGSASVTFSSIPQGYAHLQLRILTFIDTGNPTMIINVNSDTGSNYSYHRLLGAYNGATSSAQGTRSSYALGFGGSPSYGQVGIIDFLDYTDTSKYKTVRSLIGSDSNNNYSGSTQNGHIGLWSGVWSNTNAITSMVIAPEDPASKWAQYSKFALYGIKD